MNKKRVHVAKKDGALMKTHIDTEVEDCSCSLTPSTVYERSVMHNFNSLIDTMKPFSDMKLVEYAMQHTWLKAGEQITEQGWKTQLRTKRDWEEREAIRRIKLEMF